MPKKPICTECDEDILVPSTFDPNICLDCERDSEARDCADICDEMWED